MKHLAWRAILIIGAVAAIYIVSAILYGNSFTPPRATQVQEPADDQISVIVTPLEILPSIDQVRVTVSVEPGLDFVDPITFRLKDDLNVIVSPGVDESGFELKAGSPAQSFETNLNLEGRIQDYPFDSYEAEIAIVVDRIPSDVTAAEYAPVVGGFTVPQGLVGWSVETNSLTQLSSTYSAESAELAKQGRIILAELQISRAGSTIVFSILLLGLMVTLAVISILTAWLIRSRRDTSTPWRPASIVASLLFALIPIRLFLPGDPPLGSWIDILVFFWVEMSLMAALAVIVGGHVMDRTRQHRIDLQEAQAEQERKELKRKRKAEAAKLEEQAEEQTAAEADAQSAQSAPADPG